MQPDIILRKSQYEQLKLCDTVTNRRHKNIHKYIEKFGYDKDVFCKTNGDNMYYSVNSFGETECISIENKIGVLPHTKINCR